MVCLFEKKIWYGFIDILVVSSMGKKTKSIGERLQENEEIIKELLAEGLSERQAYKQLANRAIEKWAIKQMLEGAPIEACKENKENPPKQEQPGADKKGDISGSNTGSP
jgi:uncharacterized protein YoaH (UPF0181 family)